MAEKKTARPGKAATSKSKLAAVRTDKPQYWLFKSEPGAWSWDDQVATGKAGGEWDGVRNYLARNNMRVMKKGDLAFFYHSVNEKQVVGVIKVKTEAHPDTTDTTGKWECVDVVAVKPFPKAVTLEDVKADPRLEEMALVKTSRLSVQPVTAKEWAIICKLGGLDPKTIK
jgi:predicted RNA-binding protein with PUA-like domain